MESNISCIIMVTKQCLRKFITTKCPCDKRVMSGRTRSFLDDCGCNHVAVIGLACTCPSNLRMAPFCYGNFLGHTLVL
jgi:hypothetical protein